MSVTAIASSPCQMPRGRSSARDPAYASTLIGRSTGGGARLQVHQDAATFHGDAVAADPHRRVHGVGPGGDVPLPAVPRTGDDRAGQLALAERPAAVEA